MINQFRKSNSLWFYEQVEKYGKTKMSLLHNNNYTFIVNNKMNSDPEQKGCIKVPQEIDLIFIQLPIKFLYSFFY